MALDHSLTYSLIHSLTHSLTHSIFINLFIKVRLNTLLLPPLLSITFVSSAFYAYVWNILEGTSKANFFSRHINYRDGFCLNGNILLRTLIISSARNGLRIVKRTLK